jgi:hypothetical protein
LYAVPGAFMDLNASALMPGVNTSAPITDT